MNKGLLPEFFKNGYDIICFQEVKLSDLDCIRKVVPIEYHIYGNITSIGRNGVLILSRIKAISVEYTIGHRKFDEEGRYIKAVFSDFILINLYMPHGGRDKSRLPYKIEVARVLVNCFEKIANKKVVIATDFNIARDNIDVCRTSQNHNNIMFTQEERTIINNIFNIGYRDAYREIHPKKAEYTWWSYAFDCRKKILDGELTIFLFRQV